MKPTGEVFDSEWKRRTTINVCPISEVEPFIQRHYLHKRPGVVVLCMSVAVDGILKGTILFSLPPLQTIKRYGGETWELARLFLDDDLPTNSETFVISRAVKFIKKTKPHVHCLVSYADPSVGHAGTIYKAANWVADGRTDEGRKTPRCDYMDARTGKKYGRRSHVPQDAQIVRVPRVSKWRFIYRLRDNA